MQRPNHRMRAKLLYLRISLDLSDYSDSTSRFVVDRQALVPLFARGHPDLEDLRRLLPVQQVWGKGMSR